MSKTSVANPELALDFGLGVKTQIYNNELRKRRQELGLFQNELAIKLGLSETYISRLESFRLYPDEISAKKIAKFLHTTPEVLFPKWLEMYKLKKSSIDKEVRITELSLDSPEYLELASGVDVKQEQTLTNSVENQLLRQELENMLEALPPRLIKIIKMRFGLDDDSIAYTLEEVAEFFSVTRERIRQMEAKGLAHLRKHKNAKKLYQYISLNEKN